MTNIQPWLIGGYLRISDDREGEEAGVTRQQEDVSEMINSRLKNAPPGSRFVSWYIDNDVSATDHTRSGGRKAKRENYERINRDIKAGYVNVVAAWKSDRFYREPIELEHIIRMVDIHGLNIWTVRSGHIDLSTYDGQMVARILGAAAKNEVDKLSERTEREALQKAQAGAYPPSGHRGYGYTRDGSLIPKEGRSLRYAIEKLFNGVPLSAIVKEFNRKGIPCNDDGGLWETQTLKRILASPRIAGIREYKGQHFKGQWKPIATKEEHERLKAILLDSSRSTYYRPKGQVVARTYEASGILKCGRCGLLMVGRPKQIRGKPCRSYGCYRKGGCMRLSAVAEPVDKSVRDMTVVALLNEEFIVPLLKEEPEFDPEIVETISKDEDKLSEVRQDYADDMISRNEFYEIRERINERLEANKSSLMLQATTNPLHGFIGSREQMVERWGNMVVEERHAILRKVYHSITVAPAPQKGARWNIDRLNPDWRV